MMDQFLKLWRLHHFFQTAMLEAIAIPNFECNVQGRETSRSKGDQFSDHTKLVFIVSKMNHTISDSLSIQI